MSRSSSPIFVFSHSASPELTYPNAGNTPFPSASPTPFAGNVPIPPMNTHTSTPDSIPTYIRDYEDAANDLMVAHMSRMMGLSSEEATAFVAMHQSVLEPFLRGVSPPPCPPTSPTPEPLMMPPRYHNLSPEAPDYNLMDSEAFPLPPLAPTIPSPVETHVSYLPSPIHNPADDLDEVPDGEWPSNPPSPNPSSSSSNNAPVVQAFIQTEDDPVETQVRDKTLIENMALVLYEGSCQLDVACMNAAADEEHATLTPEGPQPGTFPGPGWHDNWDATGTHHFFVIPVGKQDTITPFISYDLNCPFPELLATQGHGCTVHSWPLHARADPSVARCPYGPSIEQFFIEDGIHTDAVNWAARQEDDTTLRGELQYFRTYYSHSIRLTKRLGQLCKSLQVEREALYRSSTRLSGANAYAHLHHCIERDLSTTTSGFLARKIRVMKNATCTLSSLPSEAHLVECSWCGKAGHPIEQCYSIGYCQHCSRRGHADTNCCRPHDLCLKGEDCKVYMGHLQFDQGFCASLEYN